MRFILRILSGFAALEGASVGDVAGMGADSKPYKESWAYENRLI